MAFDAGAIVARLDIDTADASRKLDDFEHKADQAAKNRRIRLDAAFDNASVGKARSIFAQLDNQLSRDAAQRLRSSPQGSVLGALNALFSPHQIAGSVSPQQAVSQGMLGQVAKQTAKSLPGANTTSTQPLGGLAGGSPANSPQAARENERVRRSFLGGLLGGIFGGGGGGGSSGGGGGSTGSSGGGSSKGGATGFLKNLVGGAGPNILGLSTKLTGAIGLGGSLLGAVPALGAVGAGIGVAGGGAALLIASNKNLQKQAKDSLDSVKNIVVQAAGPLIKPLEQVFSQLPKFFKSIGPELKQLFAGAAPLLRPLITGLEALIKGLLPGLIKILDAAKPAFAVFAQILGTLGKDIGGLFAAFAPAIRESAPILKALFDLIGGLLPIVGKLAAIFAKALAPAFVAFAAVIKELTPVLTLIGHVLASLSAAIIGDLVSAFTAIATLIKDIGPSLNVLAHTFEMLFNVLENSGAFAVLGDALETLAPLLAKLINAIVIGLAPILAPLVQLLSSVANIGIMLIVTAVRAVTPLLLILIKQILVPLIPLIQALIPFINLLARVIGDLLVAAIKLLVPILNVVIKILGFLVDTIIGSVLKAFDWLVTKITWVSTNWSQAWSDIQNAAGAAWSWIDNNVWQPFERVFTTDIPNWFRTGVNAVKQVWTDIQDVVAAPVNWIIQHPIDGLIHAFDWISSKVGGPTITPLQPISLSSGGRLGGFGGGDVIPALLEPGEAVIDKHRTRKFASLFAAMGVPGFKHGGLLHDIGSFFGDLVHGGGILAALATGNLTAATNDFMKLLGGTGVGGAVGDFAQLLTAIPHYLINTAVHDLISLFKSGGGGSGGGIAGNVGSYRGVILRVLAMLGQPSSDLGVVERQMTTESGGNPDIVNKWDINWKEGHPSVGLMQVIRGTFDAFAGPFKNVGPFLYGVSTNPLANIFAGLNYAVHDYGPGWTSVLGQGHGYDSGGWLQPGWALNMTKGREAVLTPSQSEAHMTLAEFARQWLKGGGSSRGGIMRDAYFQLPEGATVAQALSDLTFKLNTMTQEAGVMPP